MPLWPANNLISAWIWRPKYVAFWKLRNIQPRKFSPLSSLLFSQSLRLPTVSFQSEEGGCVVPGYWWHPTHPNLWLPLPALSWRCWAWTGLILQQTPKALCWNARKNVHLSIYFCKHRKDWSHWELGIPRPISKWMDGYLSMTIHISLGSYTDRHG